MPSSIDGLTRSQLAAVTHPEGPLMVVGGAGTGKTHVLTRRFGWLVEQGVEAESVLAISFSPQAANRMRQALEELVDPPYEELHSGTFRSLCARLLRDEALEAGLDPAFVPVTPADRVALLLDRIDELQLRHHEIRGNPAPLLASFVSRIDMLKEEMISPPELQSHVEQGAAEAHEADDAQRARRARELEFAGVYADHERLLSERGALDFGDLLLRTFRLLHEKPQVRERVTSRFRHVLVDEHHDTSFAQGMVLALLCERGRQITVAGDPRQSIDRFRGASEKNLHDFREAFPEAEMVRLEESRRCRRRILAVAAAVLDGKGDGGLSAREGGEVRFWRCASERAQAQAVAAEVDRLISAGVAPDGIGVVVQSVKDDGTAVGAALEERAVPFRLTGSGAFFARAEVRDVLAWLRLLADPGDSGAAVRALSRPPVALHSVDIARLTQLARRRKLDIPAAVAAALDGPQLSPEGRDRAQAFLRLYRAALGAFENRRPDAFVLRLIERVGIRRQQVFATQADTVERLRNIARLPELATAFMRREPQATPRDFARYLKAIADSRLPEAEADSPLLTPSVRVMGAHDLKGCEFDHVFVLGVSAARMAPGEQGTAADGVPDALLKERLPAAGFAEPRMRRLLHVAMTRAREGLVLAWAEGEAADGGPERPSPFVAEACAATGTDEEAVEEELFGAAEGLHSTFRIMRDELLDTVARVGGRLGEMRLDTAVDVSSAVASFLELVKVAAVIERSKTGQALDEAIEEVNQLLAQGATPEQREILAASALDGWLRDAGRDPERRPASGAAGSEPSLDPFIPRRGDGLMLSASDIETYRICPLKYKFARVFRIPQEPTINQRFGIALHQVLERFHQHTGGTRQELFDLFELSWRRSGFGETDDELQFRERALDALERYWERVRDEESEPVWFERGFSFRLGAHLVRGRVDRVDRRVDGSYELIDYKTGKARTEQQLREDVQLSVYQMGARESWGLETSAQSYFYVMTGEKVPVEHSEEQLERVRATIAAIGDGIMRQDFQPTPSPEICPFCDYRIICPAAEK
ncbi:MAG: ATP-dependent helicase [Thermoleophilaceae bacterium]|nr:ATP-dependent helicase [Thermoleophilaceae bacterium]